jgi:hypothetical protein
MPTISYCCHCTAGQPKRYPCGAEPNACGSHASASGGMAYLLVTESALTAAWTTPWVWSARPPHDLGGALCAALAFAAGMVLITLRGACVSARE